MSGKTSIEWATAVGIELNPEYVRLIEKRCSQLAIGI